MIDRCNRPLPCSARKSSGSESAPKPSAPIFRKLRRERPSQKQLDPVLGIVNIAEFSLAGGSSRQGRLPVILACPPPRVKSNYRDLPLTKSRRATQTNR